VTRRQRLLGCIVAGVIAMVINFLSLAEDLPAGRMSWTQLTFFVIAAAGVVFGVRRFSRPAPTVNEANWSRVKLGALLILAFATLLNLFLIAFGVAEAIGPHHYGWLLLVPLGLWGLTKQLPGVGKVWRADLKDYRGRSAD
jgi:hypothetical protein